MILITGASRGIGKFLFDKFTERGDPVYGTYFSENSECSQNKKYFHLDVKDYANAEEIINKLSPEISKFILINCAGNNYNSFTHKSSPEEWSKVIMTNLVGTYNMIRAALPVMREKLYGRIINFSSVVAETGIPGTSAYAASKSGLWGMTRSMAVENASKGITINNLNLGYFDIGMITEVSAEYQDLVRKKIPTGKFGDPENIFNAIKFICDSEYINGTSLDINGGLF
ncbi:MAG: SDR family oxidoreductase [Ignavibacteria bacterium]|nr:SDR family oxidoreductase [Ignavibacteria bacterium]